MDDVIAAVSSESQRLGDPVDGDPPGHPRRVLRQNVGYFTRHKGHMNYPAYRARGWPIGSGVTEAAVKQCNKRVKGSEQFWTEAGVETIFHCGRVGSARTSVGSVTGPIAPPMSTDARRMCHGPAGACAGATMLR